MKGLSFALSIVFLITYQPTSACLHNFSSDVTTNSVFLAHRGHNELGFTSDVLISLTGQSNGIQGAPALKIIVSESNATLTRKVLIEEDTAKAKRIIDIVKDYRARGRKTLRTLSFGKATVEIFENAKFSLIPIEKPTNTIFSDIAKEYNIISSHTDEMNIKLKTLLENGYKITIATVQPVDPTKQINIKLGVVVSSQLSATDNLQEYIEANFTLYSLNNWITRPESGKSIMYIDDVPYLTTKNIFTTSSRFNYETQDDISRLTIYTLGQLVKILQIQNLNKSKSSISISTGPNIFKMMEEIFAQDDATAQSNLSQSGGTILH